MVGSLSKQQGWVLILFFIIIFGLTFFFKSESTNLDSGSTCLGFDLSGLDYSLDIIRQVMSVKTIQMALTARHD